MRLKKPTTISQVLDAEHESNRIQFEIKGLNAQARKYRKELREMLFKAIPQEGGTLPSTLRTRSRQVQQMMAAPGGSGSATAC